jgi:hypothetical protein
VLTVVKSRIQSASSQWKKVIFFRKKIISNQIGKNQHYFRNKEKRAWNKNHVITDHFTEIRSLIQPNKARKQKYYTN